MADTTQTSTLSAHAEVDFSVPHALEPVVDATALFAERRAATHRDWADPAQGADDVRVAELFGAGMEVSASFNTVAELAGNFFRATAVGQRMPPSIRHAAELGIVESAFSEVRALAQQHSANAGDRGLLKAA